MGLIGRTYQSPTDAAVLRLVLDAIDVEEQIERASPWPPTSTSKNVRRTWAKHTARGHDLSHAVAVARAGGEGEGQVDEEQREAEPPGQPGAKAVAAAAAKIGEAAAARAHAGTSRRGSSSGSWSRAR